MADTPALNHWAEIHKDHSVVMEFLQWMESLGILLDFEYADTSEFPTLDSHKFESLADKFFEVDRRELDKERRELLDSINRKEQDE